MGLSPSERSRGLGHINIQKGLGNVEVSKPSKDTTTSILPPLRMIR